MEHIFHNSLIDSEQLVRVAGRISAEQRYYAEVEPVSPGEYVYKTRPGTQLLLEIQPMLKTRSLELVIVINGQHNFVYQDLRRGAILHPEMPNGCYTIAFAWPRSGGRGLGTMVLNNTNDLRQFTFPDQNQGDCHIDFLFYSVTKIGNHNRYKANPKEYDKRHLFDYDSYLSLQTSLVQQTTR